MLCSEIDG